MMLLRMTVMMVKCMAFVVCLTSQEWGYYTHAVCHDDDDDSDDIDDDGDDDIDDDGDDDDDDDDDENGVLYV